MADKLGNLKQVILDRDDCTSPLPMSFILACLQLPALERIQVSMLDWNDFYAVRVRPVDWNDTSGGQDPILPRTSNVTKLHLGSIPVDAQEDLVEILVAAPKRLQEFSLKHMREQSWRQSTEEEEKGVDSPNFIGILLKYARESLEWLKFSSSYCRPKVIPGLHEFSNLRCLDIELWFLVGTENVEGKFIAKSMPRTLQHLILRDEGWTIPISAEREHFLTMMKDFLESKSTHLLKLARFDFLLHDIRDLDGQDDYFMFCRSMTDQLEAVCQQGDIHCWVVCASHKCHLKGIFNRFDWWQRGDTLYLHGQRMY